MKFITLENLADIIEESEIISTQNKGNIQLTYLKHSVLNFISTAQTDDTVLLNENCADAERAQQENNIISEEAEQEIDEIVADAEQTRRQQENNIISEEAEQEIDKILNELN